MGMFVKAILAEVNQHVPLITQFVSEHRLLSDRVPWVGLRILRHVMSLVRSTEYISNILHRRYQWSKFPPLRSHVEAVIRQFIWVSRCTIRQGVLTEHQGR